MKAAGDGGAAGRCLGSQGLQILLARVQADIIARGYTTTRVLAQPQDLSAGRLVLTVIPGRLRKVRMAEGADARGNTFSALPLSEGDVLDLRAIEQGLENLKRVPTAEADIEITPSEEADAQAGDSDLVVQYRQAFPFRFSASLDDGGARTTGRHQAGVTVAYDNWWTLNDLFYANLTQPGPLQGSRQPQPHAALFAALWLLAALGDALRQPLSPDGGGRLRAGALQRPCRNRRAEAVAAAAAWRHQQDPALGQAVAAQVLQFHRPDSPGPAATPDERVGGGLAAPALHRQRRDRGEPGYRRALDRQGKAPEDELDLPQITARYGLWLADAALQLPFQVGAARFRYGALARAQWNRGRLPAQDQFAIGGRYTVRGFDGDLSLQGERGWLLRNELAWGGEKADRNSTPGLIPGR
jgi:hemolysin activation/secretion protein